ncbi:MAG: hypothetical protein LQ343_005831 [Gyalolechia ehrenbergii]|nr:MAG: hypothetical protein LQ343_005831 [Gyalolechia ehrenbergii]
MVHYIRFLKSPRFDLAVKSPKQVPVSALITITTDLGDAFYPGDLSIYTAIVTRLSKIPLGLTFWKPGMRCLKIETKVPLEYLTSWARLLFSGSASLEADTVQLGKVPYIVSAWTEAFKGPQDAIADVVVRGFTLLEGKVLEIWEENGESIACHICHKETLTQQDDRQCTILELGTGCGLVGLVLGSLMQNSRLILTDVDEGSLKLATENAQKTREIFNSVWECRFLDWKEPRKFTFDGNLTFIVASDCTYNPDSIPHLVQTIADLAQRSVETHKEAPSPQVIVSTKRRHPSEAIFFELMSKSGFEQKEHTTVSVHDQYRESVGQDIGIVDIYIFERPMK